MIYIICTGEIVLSSKNHLESIFIYKKKNMKISNNKIANSIKNMKKEKAIPNIQTRWTKQCREQPREQKNQCR